MDDTNSDDTDEVQNQRLEEEPEVVSRQGTTDDSSKNSRPCFNARSSRRKRLRPRPVSQTSDSNEEDTARQEEAMELADCSSPGDSSDSSPSMDMNTSGNGDDMLLNNQTNSSLHWTSTLCHSADTRGFNTLNWHNKRMTGSRPNIPDCCLGCRKVIQGSPWMVGRWKLSKKLNKHEGCVNAVNFNDTGSLISSGSDDLHINIWDWAHSKVVSSFDSGHHANVFQSKFLPFSSNLHIVSCARDGHVRLAQLSSSGECRNTRRLGMHKGSAHKLSLDPSNPHCFYSCGEDGTVLFFDVREDKPSKLFLTKEKNSKIALYSIHSNQMSEYEFLTSGRDNFIRTYDRRYCCSPAGSTDRPAKKFCPPHLNNDDSLVKKHVTCAVYSKDGCYLIGSYNDDDIYLFGTFQQDGEDAIRRFRGHRNYATVKGVNFYGPNSEFVVSGSDCGNIFVWETATGNVVNMFYGDDGGVVNVLEPHPHDPVLATSGLDSDIKIWQPELACPLMPDELTPNVAKYAKKNAENRNAAIHDDDNGTMPPIAWILMEALRRQRRNRMNANNDSDDDENDDSDESDIGGTTSSEDEELDNDDEHDDERDSRPVRVQCAQS